jgi:chemosensory pili system protein ChpA (sensor histidine kinase/response regulator)
MRRLIPRVPVSEPEPGPSRRSSPLGEEPGGLEARGLRHWILVADDDEEIRQLLVRALTDEGYAVVSARDGVEALELANQVYPHVIILDLRMPRMSGIQFLVHSEQIPVIVLSGFLPDLPDDVAAASNIVARLEKPVSLDTLRATVRRALEC